MKATIMGALAGDTIGSAYEFAPVKSCDFDMYRSDMEYTDDTIMTIAVADWLLQDPEHKPDTLVRLMQSWSKDYPCPMGGYGGMFGAWLSEPNPQPYNSWGNGSAMRVSPVGFAFDTMQETLDVAAISAAVSHNHPEGVKGAQATAASIFLARNGASKEEIRGYLTSKFGYDLSRTCDEIRATYGFDPSCQGTVPESIIAFLQSNDYEDALRLTISLGGDADTMGAITGAVAAAFYKEIPDQMYQFVWSKLPAVMHDIIIRFDKMNKAR